MLSVHRRHLALAVASAGLAVALAACTGSGAGGGMSGMSSTTMAAATATSSYPPVAPGPAAVGGHNTADLAFASGMIPHHGQAVQMADTILAKTGNPKVKALAERIKKAQSPEIATMTGWVKGWGQRPPDPYAGMGAMPGMDHGAMMNDRQLTDLAGATGTAADKLFLSQMQQHHQGAVTMAKAELVDGTNPEAMKLAQAIVTGQTAEIQEMKALLATLG